MQWGLSELGTQRRGRAKGGDFWIPGLPLPVGQLAEWLCTSSFPSKPLFSHLKNDHSLSLDFFNCEEQKTACGLRDKVELGMGPLAVWWSTD